MSLTLITALEIFSNPQDLYIFIGQKDGSDKFAFAISRGPGHNFKPMLSTTPFFETEEVAIDEIKKILEQVREAATKELEDEKSMASQFLKPEGMEIDQSKMLNQELIDRIVEELKKSKSVNTWEMLKGVG